MKGAKQGVQRQTPARFSNHFSVPGQGVQWAGKAPCRISNHFSVSGLGVGGKAPARLREHSSVLGQVRLGQARLCLVWLGHFLTLISSVLTLMNKVLMSKELLSSIMAIMF
jgi:hypothetical protein